MLDDFILAILVSGKYNDYLKVNEGTIGCTNGAVKPANVHYINKDTPVIKLLSLEDQCQNDWLYIVLVDIVSISVTTYIATYVHVNDFLPFTV